MNALSFITNTLGVASPFDASGTTRTGDHSTTVIGYQRGRERCYFLESYDDTDQAPALLAMNLTGQYAGRLVPVKEPVNENDDSMLPIERRVMSQVAELAPLLRPLEQVATDRIQISSRVVRRTALMLGHDTTPVRKFVVKVALGVPGSASPWRHHYISTYLRPNVVLERVYQIPNRASMIAILSYVGLPYGLGDRVEQPVLLESD